MLCAMNDKTKRTEKWPTHFPGVNLELVLYEERPEQFPDKIPFEKPTGFVGQMQWRHKNGELFRKCRANLFDYEEVIKDCDGNGVDLQVACTVPVMFNYDLDATVGAEWSRFLNQDLSGTCKKSNGRIVGLGTLPLQHPESAAKEAERAIAEDGLRGFQIGSHVNLGSGENMYLYDRRLDCVWATLE
eukprot:g16909.t1